MLNGRKKIIEEFILTIIALIFSVALPLTVYIVNNIESLDSRTRASELHSSCSASSFDCGEPICEEDGECYCTGDCSYVPSMGPPPICPVALCGNTCLKINCGDGICDGDETACYCPEDCGECDSDIDCTDSDLPACTEWNTCVQCLENTHCDGDSDNQYCYMFSCRECLEDQHCETNSAQPYCANIRKECVECKEDKHCTEDKPYCLFYEEESPYEPVNKCVECKNGIGCDNPPSDYCKDESVLWRYPLTIGCRDNECEWENTGLEVFCGNGCVENPNGDDYCNGCSCEGKECGDDGCGGSCGSCNTPPENKCVGDELHYYEGSGTCSENSCSWSDVLEVKDCDYGCVENPNGDDYCEPDPFCTPNCSEDQCGGPDQCGGTCPGIVSLADLGYDCDVDGHDYRLFIIDWMDYYDNDIYRERSDLDNDGIIKGPDYTLYLQSWADYFDN